MTLADRIDRLMQAVAAVAREEEPPAAVTVVRYPAESVEGLTRTRFAVDCYETPESSGVAAAAFLDATEGRLIGRRGKGVCGGDAG